MFPSTRAEGKHLDASLQKEKSLLLALLRPHALVVPSGFDAVATDLHVAPAAAAIFGAIDEEPAAIFGRADADVLDLV